MKTLTALCEAGFHDEAAKLSGVCGKDSTNRWERYARDTFLAHAHNVPADKLRFLQYVKKPTAAWWRGHRNKGAVLLGESAESGDLSDHVSDWGARSCTTTASASLALEG